MLLVLDDLQDASPLTLDLVGEIATAQPRGLMLLALSRREDDLRDVAAIDPLPLDGLSLDGVASLVRECLAELREPRGADVEVIAPAVLHETGGNPDHVLEIIAHLLTGGALERRSRVTAGGSCRGGGGDLSLQGTARLPVRGLRHLLRPR